MIDEVVADEHVHDRQHQRNVGSGERLEEPIGRASGHGPDRVDHHDLGTVLTRLFDERPEVSVGEAGVRRPQNDVTGMSNLGRVGT